MPFLVGTFGLDFPIFISTMSVTVFHAGAGQVRVAVVDDGGRIDRRRAAGRVLAISLAIALGGTPIGAPIVGLVANTCGPRWALGVAAIAGFGAAAIGIRHRMRHQAPGVPLAENA